MRKMCQKMWISFFLAGKIGYNSETITFISKSFQLQIAIKTYTITDSGKKNFSMKILRKT